MDTRYPRGDPTEHSLWGPLTLIAIHPIFCGYSTLGSLLDPYDGARSRYSLTPHPFPYGKFGDLYPRGKLLRGFLFQFKIVLELHHCDINATLGT